MTLARASDGAAEVANLIGMDVLKDFRLQFDFANNRLGIDLPEESSEGLDFHELRLDKRFHPYVDVQFAQTRTSAVWDSGASLTVADMDFVHRHPSFFKDAGQSKGTDSTGHEKMASLFVMFGLVIGGSAFPPHRIAAVDLSSLATIDAPMDLILGYSTLRHADWLLDFPRTRWALSVRSAGR